jgi:hypothetical protein
MRAGGSAAAAMLLVATATSCGTDALSVATDDVRTMAERIRADLETASPDGHGGVEEYISNSESAVSGDKFGEYRRDSGSSGSVEAVLVSQGQTGGGLSYESETVVLCVTFTINMSTESVSIEDRQCPPDVFEPTFAAGEWSTADATEVQWDG